MNWQGWMFMLLAWSFIGVLFFYSFKRILFGDKRLNHENKKERFDNNRRHKNNN